MPPRNSRPSRNTNSPRSDDAAQRVFADELGRLWNATLTTTRGEPAVVFSCITDSRQKVRAYALGRPGALAESGDDTLREWLARAPRLGPLA